MTSTTCEGLNAFLTNTLGSSSHSTMSIFSPPNSLTTASTRTPLAPTQAPTASISPFSEVTLILERSPASRATDLTITVPS